MTGNELHGIIHHRWHMPNLWFLDWGAVWKGSVSLMEIVVYGEPVPQGRPKFVRIGNHVHTYDPEKSRSYKQLVRFWVTQHLKKIEGFKPYENALCVDLTFYLGIPSSWTKKRKLEASMGQIRHTKKPDTDNLVKCVTDSCNGLLWVDDSIITDLTARKRYTSELARVVIKITEVTSC